MAGAQFETVTLGNIRLHILQSDKFKTTALAVLIEQALSAEQVTKTALLPQVLQRGTVHSPTTLELQRRSDELYGASFYGDVYKRGERHVMQFGIDLVNEQYLQEKTPLLEKGIDFLSEMLFEPVLEAGHFRSAYVDSEKQILRQKLTSLQDDKIRYAAKRLNEEMCKDEPYALHAYGRLDDLAEIDASSLYTYYQEVLKTCPIDIYCVGQVDPGELTRLIEQRFAGPLAGNQRQPVVNTRVTGHVRDEQLVVEKMDVNQAKLNIGCRTQVTIEDEAYPALMLYNGILGGFAHSKLFMNVREKASLAYYCSSRLESHKGLLSIQSGIEIDQYDQALAIIKKQLQEMAEGKISDQEIEKTKATLINQFRERQDSAYGMIDLHHHSNVSKRHWPLDELLTRLQQTSRAEISAVAEQVQIDTIYFLRDQGGVQDAKA